MAHSSLSRVDHRPWAIPRGPWIGRQSWLDLLFAHWPVPAEQLRPLVPPELQVQEFQGTSWIGVVPFRMAGIAPRGCPDIPGLSAFPELNVRLYVERDGKPGVWFLSLDATKRIAVWAARRFFHLPYYLADIEIAERNGTFDYRARRPDTPDDQQFHAQYRPVSDTFAASPGSLEAFLAERYCLYAQDSRGTIYRVDVHHVPWPLQRAQGTVDPGYLLAAHGLQVTGEPLLHFSRGVDTIVWNLEKLVDVRA
ncbi:MAG: YqjF family protein [Planctomycetota bacterium]